MTPLAWQKSSYSEGGSSCINVAVSPTGTLHLRESDDPEVILTTTRTGVRTLLAHLRAGHPIPGQPGA